MSAGDIISEELKKRNMSQNKLARLAQISQAGLNSIIHGQTSPKESTLQAIADALRIPMSVLLGENAGDVDKITSRYEIELHSYINMLNTQGLDKLLEYARDLSENDRYTKGVPSRKAE